MPTATSVSLWTLITPAFIATVISIAIANRGEKLRAHRDFYTKSFEAARDTVAAAVVAASEYFPLDATKRTPVIEAKVWMAERELRFALSAIIENASLFIRDDVDKLTANFDDFVGYLTGGSFQSRSAQPDLKQLRLIAAAGAELRAQLLQVRHAELRAAIRRDPLSRILLYFSEERGIGNSRT